MSNRNRSRITALCAAGLLLAAPAAFACGELSAMLVTQCAMGEAPVAHAAADAPMAHPADSPTCHKGGQMLEDCCVVEPAPEPMQASSFESVKLFTALEVANVPAVAPVAPAARPRHPLSADAFRLHGLGRYTLFSSFLL